MKMITKSAAVNLIAAAFIFLFTYTAISKLNSFNSFRFTLGQSPLVGDYKNTLAIVLPLSELVIAVLLFFPGTRLIGLYSSLVLMILFTLYIGYMLLFASKLPCSCGGVLQQMTWQQHLCFNLFFTLLAGMAIRIYKQKEKQELKLLLQ